MPNQPLAAVLAAADTTTGFHPGPAYFVLWALIICAVIGAPIYLVRLLRNRRNRR
jgi:TctA family transporter